MTEMKQLRWLLSLLLLLSFSAASGKADVPKAQGDYTLGADDVIDVSVANHGGFDRTLTILPDGKVTFPGVGEVTAAGRTAKAVAAEIQTALEKTMNNVSVVISVKEMHSRRVRIIGAVRSPGAFDLKPGWRLLDVVATAGGLSAKPSFVTARLIRGGVQTLPLNVTAAMTMPDSEANLRLEPDDLILFDELDAPSRQQVHVMGQVGRPGAYDLDSNLTLLTLMSEAGSATDKAALTRAYVLRGSAEIPINLRPLLVEGQPDAAVTNFKLKAGDVLFVPEIKTRYAVMGEVKSPGYYALPEKGAVTALQAFNLAGGQSGNADLKQAGIIRQINGKPTVIKVNLNLDSLLKKGELASNPALQPEDVLYIPPRKSGGFHWQDALAPLSALSILGFRIGR